MNDLEHLIRSARPAATDDAAAIRAAYEAGHRDGVASASSPVLRWRIAAGVFFAATLGLSAMQLNEQDASTPNVATAPAQPDEPAVADPLPPEPAVAPAERPPRRSNALPPQSYASLRLNLKNNGRLDLGHLSPPATGTIDQRVPRLGDTF